MSDNTLKVPIQINRDTSVEGKTLYQGELFQDGNNYIHAGTDNGNAKIKSGYADEAGKIKNIDDKFQFYSDGSATSSIANFEINKNSLDNGTLNNAALKNINSVILTSAVYGKELPTTGTDGQLFFMIME